MMVFLYRAFEEVFPIIPFWISKYKIKKQIDNDEEVSEKSKSYDQLEADGINSRIKEEHERGVGIDDKTFKFTLGLSVSLTVLAAVSGSLARYLPDSSYATFISTVCGIAALYMLAAGITALGALKTLATYGYGTDHMINQKTKGVSYVSQALYKQERMNIIRHLRNEAAYQSLRNGFLLLFFALAVSVAAYSSSKYVTKLDSTKTGILLEDQEKQVEQFEASISEEKDEHSIEPSKN